MTIVEIRGLKKLIDYIESYPKIAKSALRLANNDAARFAARLGSARIRLQVRFSRAYLGDASSADAKLRIKKFARGNDLESIIAARERPTSLARFSLGTPTFGRRAKGSQAPRVKVKASGGVVQLRKAFYVKLRRGPTLTEDQFNIGLAVRLKKGESLQATIAASPLGGGAYLLYGPSVAQVFSTVREDIAGDVADYQAGQFLRQFERASRG